MKFTISWLKEHLDTKYKNNEIIEKLTDIGLEVESYENVGSLTPFWHPLGVPLEQFSAICVFCLYVCCIFC